MQERISLSEQIATGGTYHRIKSEDWLRIQELFVASCASNSDAESHEISGPSNSN